MKITECFRKKKKNCLTAYLVWKPKLLNRKLFSINTISLNKFDGFNEILQIMNYPCGKIL